MTVPRVVEPDLSFLLDHTSHVLRTRMAAALAEIGLTPRMQCVLLHAIGQERTQAQLAEIRGIDKTTMVATVDALENAGFARRVPSSTDRRARIIVVTEAGAEIARRGQEIADGVHAAALNSLPAADRDVLVRAMERLAAEHLADPVEAAGVRRARQ
ncbi:MarR family winged helix-turn-helix transcriptional regulator [Nocardia takedensis]